MPERPSCHVIAGPNGAGKTTFARKFLPHYARCVEFLNPDLIAQGLSPFDPERAAMMAGRLLLRRIRELARHGADFAIETTLSGRSYLPLFRRLKNNGYVLRLFYLWVPSEDLCLLRIRERVEHGGHNVAEEDVRRRYSRSIKNAFALYAEVMDAYIIYDNSGAAPEPVLRQEGAHREILDPEKAARILREDNL
ncbi:MAG TPA: zeta toxin family protein [Candidatus Hydrogenedentes bacterium]|nr:zeta toxin family protein [Candidatus Hydrogenedentota bacterium]HNT87772.1 zeta toxin family protein [Candidatus Hydrogenedentota bacterium]